ncbi:MFS transporter [Nonomuraea sp. NPDC005983]|uniref:MFS transporter n=1 Tax=Nonomuraea sp. NPDC005983 TaxID=3155595 RepID=UPI0033A849DA
MTETAAGIRRGNAGLLLAVMSAVQFLDAMDIASIGPALPLLQRDLGMSPEALQWVVSGYALGFGGFLLLGGRLADLFDRRRLLLGWLVVFVVASLVGGLTSEGLFLVIARLVKGVSAGFTAPVAMALLLDTFREERARNRALGTFLAISSSGFSLGLVFGGALAQLDWRLVFLLPAAVGVAVALVAAAVVPRDRRRRTRTGRLDVLGAMLVAGAAITLVYGVSQASIVGWSHPLTLAALGVSALLLALLLVVERRHPAPLIPLSIFARAGMVRANVGMLMFGAYVAFQFVLTLYYEGTLGWSPLQTALSFLLGGLLTGTTARYWAAAVTRFGAWPVATAGLFLLAVSYAVWAVLIGRVEPLALLLIQQVLGGVGFPAAYSALNIAAVAGAGQEEHGLASGLFNASAQLGTSLVTAVTATMLVASGGAIVGGYRAGLWTVVAVSLAITLLSALGTRTPQP